MKKSYILLIFAIFPLNFALAQPQIIAHRGHWNVEGSYENSITALREAQKLQIYGSEFDVWMTCDGVLVINHDGVIEGFKIEDTPYEKLKDIRLPNGERLPLLEDYLRQGKECRKTKLILELKSHSSKEREDSAVAAVIEMVEKIGLKEQTEYISFSLNICKEFVRLSPNAAVAYLKGDLAPHELKALNVNGISYSLGILRKNLHWIEEAQKIGMTVNVWTLYHEVDMLEMITAKVNFITTDNPVLAKELVEKKKNNNSNNNINN